MRGMRLIAVVLLLGGSVWFAPLASAQQAGQATPPQTAENFPARAPEKPAEQQTINPWIPPPPPPDETGAAGAQPVKAAPRELPAKVTLGGGTRIDVVLETPLSTRIAKKGQEVIFRATQPISLGEGLALPEQTAFVGIVAEAKRPGAFGREGALTVEMKRIDLPSGASAEIVARLDSPDMKGKGRISSDSNGKSNLANLALWTLAGTAIGARAAGAKGAGYGAASGAAVALIMMMSHRGADVYLEPGMPFSVMVDRAVELPGSGAVLASKSPNGPADSAAPSSRDSDMPKLQHRPKPQR